MTLQELKERYPDLVSQLEAEIRDQIILELCAEQAQIAKARMLALQYADEYMEEDELAEIRKAEQRREDNEFGT